MRSPEARNLLAERKMNTDDSHTVLVNTYRQAAQTGDPNVHYKGLRIHALPGLHEFTFALMAKHAPSGAAVLDLAAGSGAMSLRLADAGYRVTATDYVAENFRLSEQIPFFAADLNDHFSAGREGVFDIVFASEIIEHLENPRHFARQCFKLLKPGGKVILSTPNVDTAPSVARFLRSGHYQWFDEENYRDDGHITPLSQGQIDKCFTEAGFAINWKGSFGERTMLLRGSPRMMLMSFLLDKLMPLNDSLKQQIFVAVLQKPATAHS